MLLIITLFITKGIELIKTLLPILVVSDIVFSISSCDSFFSNSSRTKFVISSKEMQVSIFASTLINEKKLDIVLDL